MKRRDDRPALRRRELCATGSAWAILVACGVIGPRAAARAATGELAFDATSLDEVLAAIGAQGRPDDGIELGVPDLSEDGAFVPVTVSSRLPGTRTISIVAEHNPNPLVVQFTFAPGTDPWISTRVKVAESGRLYAVVHADGGVYSTSRAIAVQRGGCG